PSVDVVPDAAALLHRLAYGTDDFRKIALIEEDFPSAFRGSPAIAEEGSVELTRDEPERINLLVRAPAPGFVFLADQFYPGWTATVNGVPTTVARANYVFRLVEVGPGESIVKFRYRPTSVRLGALIAFVSVIGVGG